MVSRATTIRIEDIKLLHLIYAISCLIMMWFASKKLIYTWGKTTSLTPSLSGKPSTITGTSTADVLRQFQGSMIERVEVITNPSARYDAEGTAGILNIILRIISKGENLQIKD